MMQPETPLFAQCYSAWLVAQQSRRLSGNYLNLLAITQEYWLKRLGSRPLADYTPDDIRAWLIWLAGDEEGQEWPGDKPLSSASVDIHYRNIKAFWLWAEREELVKFGGSPVRKVARPKHTEKLPDVLSPDECKELLEAILKDKDDHNRFRNYCIFLFFSDTGVRLEELARLKLADINLEQEYCKILGKGDRERIVKLGLELRRALSKYRLQYRRAANGEGALFTNDEGFAFDKFGVRTMVVRLLHKHVKRQLSKYGPHLLRHTFATTDILVNGRMEETSRRLGHRDLETTKRYDHLADMIRQGNFQSPMDAILAK